MNARLNKIYLLITASLVAFGLFLFNDVGSSSPHSDGGSHYVTGLLAYDWIHLGHLTNPIAFGTEYFKHFPYIGLLLWPPFFYFLEMVAFSMLGPTTHTSLVLVTCIFVACGVLLGYALLKSGRSNVVAHGAVAAMLTSILVQDAQRNVLIDGLVAFLSFATALAFSSYVLRPTLRGAIGISILAILAFYSKGNAMQLAFVLPLVAILMRRPQALFLRTTLLLAAICIVVTGPWLYLTAGLSGQGALYAPGIGTFLKLIKESSDTLFWSAALLAPFSIIGGATVIYQFVTAKTTNRNPSAFDATCLATVTGCVFFHALLAIGNDARYMLTALFGVVGLSVLGIEVAITHVKRLASQAKTKVIISFASAILMTGQTLINLLTPTTPAPMPMAADVIAQTVISALPTENRSLLVVGNHNIETAIGPALAQREGQRRLTKTGLVIVRASRALVGGGYRNRDYIAKFNTDEQYQNEIRRLGFPIVVLGAPSSTDAWPHIAAIDRILNSATSDYTKMSEIEFFPGQSVTIWRLKPNLVKPIDFDEVSMSNSLRDRVSAVTTAGTLENKKD